MKAENVRKYGEVRIYTTIKNQKTERTNDRPGGLYESFPTRPLSPPNIRQNKKPYYI